MKGYPVRREKKEEVRVDENVESRRRRHRPSFQTGSPAPDSTANAPRRAVLRFVFIFFFMGRHYSGHRGWVSGWVLYYCLIGIINAELLYYYIHAWLYP